MHIPIRVLCCVCLGFLSLRLWDFAFDLKGDTVGARDTEARRIASHLILCKYHSPPRYIKTVVVAYSHVFEPANEKSNDE